MISTARAMYWGEAPQTCGVRGISMETLHIIAKFTIDIFKVVL